MAESSLSVGVADLRAEVGFFLGYGRTADNWSAAQLAEINSVVQSGVRRVYYPPAIDASTLGYEWSWLRPTTTLDIESDTADYDLPDDFGRLVGCFHYPAEEYRTSIVHVPISRILADRAASSLTGAPVKCATRFKSSDGSAGQRQEVLFFPEPDSDWTLSYEYEAYNGALTDDYPYPLGGMQLAELYTESCLAVAEQRLDDEAGGNHMRAYELLLLDAVARDRKRGPKSYGQMGHVEQGSAEFRRGWTGGTYPITYGGEDI